MEKENENLDSPNEEITKEQSESDATPEKVKELSDKNRQLFERAKKAETELKELKSKPVEEKPESPTEPDYGRLAYLKAQNIDHPDDVNIVETEAKRLKMSLSDVLQMDHIKAKLNSQRTEREAKSGLPTTKGRTGGQVGGTVEYWLNKGGLPEDQALAEQVVDARMQKEKGPKFADEMFA